MRDSELYEKILGLFEPWHVEEVAVDRKRLEIVIRVGLRGSVVLACPECGEPMPGYDRRRRRWRHLDTCQYKTIVEAEVPRGKCARHGVHSIGVPWAEDRSRFTALFERLVIDWLHEASQAAVARELRLSWEEVHGIMERAVARGLARRRDEVVRAVGVDEKSFQKRHEYVTVVCDLSKGRVLHVGDDRRKETLDIYWKGLTPPQREGIEAVAMDMWEPYVQSVEKHLPQAAIVFDKFHIVRLLTQAVDAVRRRERAALRATGDDRLAGTRYLWLRHPERFTRKAWRDFRDLRESHLKTARAWAIKETLLVLWNYIYPGAAARFFGNWYQWAIRSRLAPIRRVAKTLRDRLPHILNFLHHPITNAVTEAINAKIQWIKYTARGFRTRRSFRTAILFHCRGLNLYPHEFR
jgi:transposase